MDETGKIIGPNDPAAQTKAIILKIESALVKLGSGLSDVVRSRIYVRHIEDWQKIGKVHGEYFRDVLPATTMVEVSRLIDPGLLLEIEVDAILSE